MDNLPDGSRTVAVARVRDVIGELANHGEVLEAAGLRWFARRWNELDIAVPLATDRMPKVGAPPGETYETVDIDPRSVVYLSPEQRWRTSDDPVTLPQVLRLILASDTASLLRWMTEQDVELVTFDRQAPYRYYVECGQDAVAVGAALGINLPAAYVESFAPQ